MRMRHPAIVALAASLLAAPVAAQLTPIPQDQGANGLGLALRRLPVTARVLYVTAHPDDENNAVLVALARGRGVATALLTLTRGDGGQNAIGPELFEALGVLRTEELAAVHRWDGVSQYFGHAFEFGFSFSLEETLAKWGHEATLGDVVRVVRLFRPDVILTLPLDAPDHQHHVAAARLAAEAFRAAGDPERFPEQLAEGLPPWQARKLYAGGVGGGNELPEAARPVVLRTGDYDPLLGMSWAEFGSLARAFHKCQAVRQLKIGPAEFREARFVLVDAEPAVASDEADLLDGLDPSVGGLAGFAPDVPAVVAGIGALETEIHRALDAYGLLAPHRTIPPLAAALRRLRELRETVKAAGLPDAARHELLHRVDAKETDLEDALALAQGIGFEVTTEDAEVVAGESVAVTARVWNPGPEAVRVEDVALGVPEGWEVRRVSGETKILGADEGLTLAFHVRVSAAARPTRPYWRRDLQRDRYDLDAPADRNLPWSPAEITATLCYAPGGVVATLVRPVYRRYEGRWVGGEKQKAVNVVPALSVRVAPEIAVFPTSGRPAASREFRVTVTNAAQGGSSAQVRLDAPAGWAVTPAVHPIRFRSAGEELTVRFGVTAPRPAAEREVALTAVVTADGRDFREGYEAVAYDHVQERHVYRAALTRALLLDVRVAPGAAVGYVAGVGDEVPEAIRQLGVPVTLLSADDLAWGDLGRFTTLVLGVRAYHARPDLRASHARVMDWVARGGHLVVQYHRGEFNPPGNAPSPYAPYPARVTTRRVTDETAAIEVLLPSSPVLTTPNRIATRDWEGWVQERGIQFLDARDAHYVDLLASADPFPKNAGTKKGILVEARVGKGTWTYVGLGLFRQLPAGTPGAYRLLANLVSRPRRR